LLPGLVLWWVKQWGFAGICALSAKGTFRALEINFGISATAADQYTGFTGVNAGLAPGTTRKEERGFTRPRGTDRISLMTPLSAEQSASRQFGHSGYPSKLATRARVKNYYSMTLLLFVSHLG
jgi:hypothetical protein